MIILLDLDGVLVDFTGGINKVLGEPKTPIDHWNCWDCYGVSEHEFWRACDSRAFWANLDWTPDGAEILRILETRFDEIYLATTPSSSPESPAGKMDWIKRNLAKKYHRNYVMGPHKELMAGPDRILIDDSDTNCTKFKRAGGNAFLYPRLWNENRWIDNPIAALKDYLNQYEDNVIL
jgi:5'(3')-deoxyribonucleotidase